MRPEPCLHDSITAHPRIHPARNGFYLWQLWHKFILGSRRESRKKLGPDLSCGIQLVRLRRAPFPRLPDTARLEAHNFPYTMRITDINPRVPVAPRDVSLSA